MIQLLLILQFDRFSILLSSISIMKKNTSQPQFNAMNIMNISSPKTKKIQGFDLTTKSSFTQKVNDLKTKPKKESIQSQYIKGLQDQIHYLELQLKLLQQKDQAKHGQIDQLQKFFSDGVPINQNILAIKNGFNNYKNTFQKKIVQKVSEKKQRESLIEGLKKRIAQMIKQNQKNQKEVRQFQQTTTDEWHSLLKNEAKVKKQIQLDDDELKNLKFQNRKLNEKLTSIQRNKQIQMVMVLKNQNHKMTKLNKLKQSIYEKQAEYDQLQKIYEDMLKQQEEKTYVIKIQEENLNLKKKAISMERQLNALQTKAQEKQMELDSKLKDRHKEISAKMQMKTRVDIQKDKINRQNSMKVQDIQKVAKEKQIATLQNIITQNKKLSKYTQYYGDLLSKVQDSIQKMVQKKPQLKNQISVFSAQVKRLAQSLIQEKQRQSEIYSQIISSQAKSENLKYMIPPLNERISKISDQLKFYGGEKEKLVQDIKVKQKQLDLLLILKSLNIEEVQMSKSSSTNIQDKINNFIRNWETLQRTN